MDHNDKSEIIESIVRKLRFNSFIKRVKRPYSNTKWFWKQNKYRIVAFILFLVLILINYFLIPIDIPRVNLKYPHNFWEIIAANFHHFEAGLIIYALFGDKIKNFLVSAQASESPELVISEYLLDILDSKREIKILETFTELLLKNETNIERHFNAFILRCKANRNNAVIKILVIDPASKHAVQRINDLRYCYDRHNQDDDYVKNFQLDMHSYLESIQRIQDRLTDGGTDKRVLFDVRIYDTVPPYSLYAADNKGYFGYYIKKPTTKSPQLIIHSLADQFGTYQLNRFEDIWNSKDTSYPTIDLHDYLDSPDAKSFIDEFNKLLDASDSEIEKILNSLSPKDTSSEEEFKKIVILIKYIQKRYKKSKIDNLYSPHYNTFGTGGDKLEEKTINISSIASILASWFWESKKLTNFIGKVGSSAVSCNVGSQTFDNSLCNTLKNEDYIKNSHPKINIKRLYYANGSKYIATKELGYEYKIEIRRIRNKLFVESHGQFVDIFKIIFPFANFTDNAGQVNGVSNEVYLFYYKKLFRELKRTGIIVYNSTHCVDEIFEGRNEVYFYHEGKLLNQDGAAYILPINIAEPNLSEYLNFFKQTDKFENSFDHIAKYFQLMDLEVKLNDDIRMTIAYNVALILKIPLILQEEVTIEELANQVYKDFFIAESIDNIISST